MCELPIPEDRDIALEARVSAGMAWLDANYPDHWQSVNLDALDVSKEWACPLAQAAETDYLTARNATGRDYQWSKDHGFSAGYDSDHNYMSYEDLTGEWRRQYKLRQDAQAALTTLNTGETVSV